MIGRALLRFPPRARLLHPTTVSRCPHDVSTRFPTTLALRPYATPGRPKSVVGEPSRPVKRAVKKAASKPNTGDSAAEEEIQTRKRTAAKKKKSAKKPPTPEEKAAKKEKDALKKEKAKASSEKKKLQDLKAQALRPPSLAIANAYTVFLTDKMKGRTFGAGSRNETHDVFRNALRELAAEWKSKTAADLEHYNHLANERRAATKAEYKRWVESHSPEEIQKANNARAQLRRRQSKGQSSRASSFKWAAIRDERAVKPPLTPYFQFNMNRQASGDFKNIPFLERARLISAEWKALSEDEKKKYASLFSQDRDRYVSEHTDIYGYAPTTNGRAEAATA